MLCPSIEPWHKSWAWGSRLGGSWIDMSGVISNRSIWSITTVILLVTPKPSTLFTTNFEPPVGRVQPKAGEIGERGSEL